MVRYFGLVLFLEFCFGVLFVGDFGVLNFLKGIFYILGFGPFLWCCRVASSPAASSHERTA